MQFLKKNSSDDFYTLLEEQLNKVNNWQEDLNKTRTEQVINNLKVAGELLKQSGLIKEAEAVETLASEVKDPPTEGLTSEKMVENLENKGWVFNVNDQKYQESADKLIQLVASMMSFGIEDKQIHHQLKEKGLKDDQIFLVMSAGKLLG